MPLSSIVWLLDDQEEEVSGKRKDREKEREGKNERERKRRKERERERERKKEREREKEREGEMISPFFLDRYGNHTIGVADDSAATRRFSSKKYYLLRAYFRKEI